MIPRLINRATVSPLSSLAADRFDSKPAAHQRRRERASDTRARRA
jgi:hypothetical protein